MPLRPIPDYGPTEIIPSAWANDLKYNQSRLDARTGFDPPTPGLFLASGSGDPNNAVWRVLSGADYKNDTIPDTALVNKHVHSLDQITLVNGQPINFGNVGALGSGFFSLQQVADAPVPSVTQWLLIQDRYYNYAADYRLQIACSLFDTNAMYVRMIVNGSPQPWRTMWHSGNGSFVPTSGGLMTGDLILTRANGPTGVLAFGGGPETHFIYFDGANFNFAGGAIQNNAGTPLVINLGATVAGAFIATGAGSFQSTLGVTGLLTAAGGATLNGGVNVAGGDITMANTRQLVFPQENAVKVRLTGSGDYSIYVAAPGVLGFDTAQFVGFHNHAAAGGDWSVRFDTINQSHTFQGTITVQALAGGVLQQIRDMIGTGGGGGGTGGGVAVDVIAMWNKDDSAPGGWVMETAFSGRFPVATGGTLGLTRSAQGGPANGTYDHSVSIAHGHANDLSFGGTVGVESNPPVRMEIVTPGTGQASPTGHGHSFTPTKSGGVTNLPGPANVTTGLINHLPPYHALHFIRKT